MPAKSAKQYRLMQAIAHGSIKRSIGPSRSVAQEFIHKTSPSKRKSFMKDKK